MFRYLSGPKTFLHISFVFFRSLIGDLLSFLFSFCSLPIFDQEFPFAFFRSLTGNFLFFPFSSFKGKDGHSHPGSRFMVSWDFGLRLVERLDNSLFCANNASCEESSNRLLFVGT